jgi:GNAT superfamily N-acetyltransferase
MTGREWLNDAERNHCSWFSRGRERVECDGATLFVGGRSAVLAFPDPAGDLAGAVRRAREAGAFAIGCWALAPDPQLAATLHELGFRDGWQPHWMGVDPGASTGEAATTVDETAECDPGLPYSTPEHAQILGGDVHHFVVRHDGAVVGHAVLNVDSDCAGIYDMGVAPQARRRGFARALTLAAVARARSESCRSVTLNATGEGEPVYRQAGFVSLGFGMTWWFP